MHSWRNNSNLPAPSYWYVTPEINAAGMQRGFSRIGAEFWPVLPDKRGNPQEGIGGRYPESVWRLFNVKSAILAPGSDGPEATTRFELLREGMQDCEARIAVDRLLVDDKAREKLGDDLANRAGALLDARVPYLRAAISTLQVINNRWAAANRDGTLFNAPGILGPLWFSGSGWEERRDALLDLAAEVAAKVPAP